MPDKTNEVYVLSRMRWIGEVECHESVGSSLDVSGDIDLFWELGDADVETVLYTVQSLGVVLVGDESDGQSLGSETSGTSDSVKVRVRILWHIVVEDDVDTLNVHSTSEQISGDENSLLEVLECLIS